METNEKKQMILLYQQKFQKYNKNPKSLHWKNKESQIIRFKVLTEAIDKKDLISNKTSILDIGCGLADFYSYLKNLGFSGKYVGTEIVPEFAKSAQKRFPEIKILSQDIFQKPLKEKFDYVFANGIMNHKLKNIEDYRQKFIKIMFTHAKKCLGFTMASKYQKFDKNPQKIHYASPEKYFSYGMSLSEKVILRHDYLWHDFAIFIYR